LQPGSAGLFVSASTIVRNDLGCSLRQRSPRLPGNDTIRSIAPATHESRSLPANSSQRNLEKVARCF
jgi:hypothetical protein